MLNIVVFVLFFLLLLFFSLYFFFFFYILLGTARMFLWICVSLFVLFLSSFFFSPSIHLPFDTCTMHFIRLRCCVVFCCCCWNFRNNNGNDIFHKTHTLTLRFYINTAVESYINWFGLVLFSKLKMQQSNLELWFRFEMCLRQQGIGKREMRKIG